MGIHNPCGQTTDTTSRFLVVVAPGRSRVASSHGVARPAFRRVGVTSSSIKALSDALPRRRKLWTNSRDPIYNGGYSRENPGAGGAMTAAKT
jgi:hypothetical protein